MSANRLSYVNHPLNNSPSKTSYSFSKSERFSHLQSKEDFQYQNDERRHISPPKVFKGDRLQQSSRRSKQKKSKSPLKGKSSSKSPKKSPKKSTSKSPSRRVRFQLPYQYNGGNRSPQRSRNERSKEEKKKITNKQLYPLGIQINNQGKYVLSTYYKNYLTQARNVKTLSFGRLPRQKSKDRTLVGPGYYDTVNHSPGKYVTSQNKNNLAYSFSKAPRKGPQDPSSDPSFGPGMYRTFSQFGQTR